MNWKLKAIMQNVVDCLPASLAYPVYYKIQRNLGNLRKISPYNDLNKSVLISKHIIKQGRDVIGSTFLEVGTGRTLDVPIGLWLCGALKIITVDKNPYLKEELIRESLVWIKDHRAEIEISFGKLLYNDRLDNLISVCPDIVSLLKLTNIKYHAPADASILPIEDNTIDYHYSINVMEHISPNIIENILLESKRILSSDGLLVHFIDLSDHFSHNDKSITSINFLQYNIKQWNKWAGNRFMYHNRLRVYDYYKLFNELGIDLLFHEEILDRMAYERLLKGFPLDDQFVEHDHETLSISSLRIVGKFHNKT